jgi:hypothetical protein
MLVHAWRQTFDEIYPVEAFRGLHVDIEYPIEPQNYPGIWVDYDDTAPLQTAGVDHSEITITGTSGSETLNRYRRWKFGGYASFTAAALTSLERDTLYDEMVRVLAFGGQAESTERFREFVESNPLIAANFDFDQIEVKGNAAIPGTPWGTDEIIYERTLSVEVIGEFVSDAETGLLVALSSVQFDVPKVLLPGQGPTPIVGGSLPTDWT